FCILCSFSSGDISLLRLFLGLCIAGQTKTSRDSLVHYRITGTVDFFRTIGYFMAGGIAQKLFNSSDGNALIMNEPAQTAYPGNIVCRVEPSVAFTTGFNQTLIPVDPQGTR